jgi:hypothetical protein
MWNEESQQGSVVAEPYVETQIFPHACDTSVCYLGTFSKKFIFDLGDHFTLTLSTSEMAYSPPSIGNNLKSTLRTNCFSEVWWPFSIDPDLLSAVDGLS